MTADFIKQGIPQADTPIEGATKCFGGTWYRFFQALWTRTGKGGYNDIVFGAAILPTDTDKGFLYLPSCAGPPTGTPNDYPGQVPAIVDITDLRVYFYISGAWKKTAVLT